MQGAHELMVWAGMWGDGIIGSLFVSENLEAESYLNMLQEKIFPPC